MRQTGASDEGYEITIRLSPDFGAGAFEVRFKIAPVLCDCE